MGDGAIAYSADSGALTGMRAKVMQPRSWPERRIASAGSDTKHALIHNYIIISKSIRLDNLARINMWINRPSESSIESYSYKGSKCKCVFVTRQGSLRKTKACVPFLTQKYIKIFKWHILSHN